MCHCSVPTLQEYAAAEQRLEAALYSGEAAAAASKATLASSKERAAAAATRLAAAKAEAETAARLVAVVAAGVDSIGDKLRRGEVADGPCRALTMQAPAGRPEPLSARLEQAGQQLKALVAEIGGRQEELAAMHDEDVSVFLLSLPGNLSFLLAKTLNSCLSQLFAIVQLPANNARVPLSTGHHEADGVLRAGRLSL